MHNTFESYPNAVHSFNNTCSVPVHLTTFPLSVHFPTSVYNELDFVVSPQIELPAS